MILCQLGRFSTEKAKYHIKNNITIFLTITGYRRIINKRYPIPSMTRSQDIHQKDISIPDLVTQSQNGNLPAFRLLMDSQKQYAYAVAFRLLHDEENASDVVQEAFIRVWNNLGRYRKEIKFTTWLYKIVVNLCYDKIKMESRRKNIFRTAGEFSHCEDVADNRDLHSELEQRDLSACVLSESKKLPPKEYLVFHLRDIHDFSIEEIAEIAGMSVGSVKTNLCYARRRVRNAMYRLQESEQL
jgi:RNA polymerase sigma-70 factor, ECF subfamily